MGKKVIDVISSGASSKSYFSNTYFLYFILISLVLSAVFLSGCGDQEYENVFEDCLAASNTETEIISGDERLLCIGDYDSRSESEDVCVRTSSLAEADTARIEQSFASLFYFAYENGLSNAMGRDDAIDAAAIAAAYFFGDGENSLIDTNGLNTEDGFYGHDHDGGSDDLDDGGRAEYSCAQRFKFDIDILNPIDEDFGPDDGEINNLEGAGVDYVPLAIVCSDEGPDEGKFDLGGPYTSGVIVTQIVEGEAEGDSTLVYAYYCDCADGACSWEELSDYEHNEEFDRDEDGSLGSLHSNWDCDDENPERFVDMSIFYGFESNQPDEICGDGVDNICTESYVYEVFSDVYEDYYESNGDLDWSIDSWDLNTVDNCDLNPEACENNCLWEGNTCDYLSPINYEDEEAEVEYIAEAYCCGANLIDDLGVIIDDPNSGANKLCLPTGDPNIVGGDTDVLNLGPEDSECSGDWCWVDPELNGFNTLTMKVVGEEPYDIVSDGNNWIDCDSETEGQGMDVMNLHANEEIANQYLCYYQGDRYVWAQCLEEAPEEESLDLKGRVAGDALFKLGSEGTDIDLANDYDTDSFYYQQDLIIDQSVDFKSYDHLEFYVMFESIEHYPANVDLSIYGITEIDDDEIVYFHEQVLGYAVNTPKIVPNKWIHVKVPVGEWYDISYIEIESNSDYNPINVKNIYLSSETLDTYYCSGYQSPQDEGNSWIEDLDKSTSQTLISGEKICQETFGEDAWFGHYSFEEVDEESASCCGNEENEYYAGMVENEDGRACWNSEVVYDDETMINVDYTVSYNKEDFSFNTPEQTCEYSIDAYYKDDPSVSVPGYSQSGQSISVSYDTSPKILPLTTVYVEDFVDYDQGFEDSYLELDTSGCDPDLITVRLLIDDTQETTTKKTIGYSKSLPNQFDVSIITETNVVEDQITLITPVTESFSYPCLEEECIYALPGIPPYTVTNSNPGLYELYYVVSDDEEEDVLITEGTATYNDFANIKVKKLSQQVLFFNQSFWGCNAANYIEDTGIFDNYDGENMGACDIQGSYYCSYQDENYLINSWSDQSIVEYGYEEIAEYEEGMEFEPATCSDLIMDCSAETRNHSTHIIPGRNFINNADFSDQDGKDVIGWELWIGNTIVEDEDDGVEDGTFNVGSGQVLKSERLALYPDSDYDFSQSSACDTEIYLYDKDGISISYEDPETFNSEGYSYLVLEVEGSCDFSEPMLQLTEDLEANGYNFDTEYPQRKAAACCPENMCWNGYLCVEDMGTHTYLTENSGNNTYRCIEGDWTHMDPKYDWNGEEYGFCTNNEQCFVTSSLSEGADAEASLSDFYTGSYPTCIESGEYLMDHYCETGEWSSRTKFLATKLLNYADSDDYMMYCSNLQNNLLDYAVGGYNYANYLEGESAITIDVESELGDALIEETLTTETSNVCFPDLSTSETGRRLVPYEENTCINNVCVLKYKQGDGFATAFATSMNLNKTDDQSFLIPLGISSSELETYCSESEAASDQFVECSDTLWYAADLNSLIYSKEGISVSGNVIDEVLDWFSGLFGNDAEEDTEDFVSETQNFNNVYIMNMENGKYVIRAIEEISGDQRTLIAEYQGFNSPICDYVNNVAEEYVQVEQWPAAPEVLVNCTLDESSTYQVSTGTDLDFWWPQLAGKMRTGIN